MKKLQSNSLNRFDEMELEEMDEITTEEKQRFEISDLSTASWAFRKIKAYEKKVAEINELAKLETERIIEWQEKEIRGITRSIEFFENLLIGYYMKGKKEDPKFKCSTPYGTVSSRKQQPKWVIQDEILINWLKEHDHEDLIRVKEEPALSDMKDAFKILIESGQVTDRNGAIVEGIRVIEQNDKVTVKTKGEE